MAIHFLIVTFIQVLEILQFLFWIKVQMLTFNRMVTFVRHLASNGLHRFIKITSSQLLPFQLMPKLALICSSSLRSYKSIQILAVMLINFNAPILPLKLKRETMQIICLVSAARQCLLLSQVRSSSVTAPKPSSKLIQWAHFKLNLIVNQALLISIFGLM